MNKAVHKLEEIAFYNKSKVMQELKSTVESIKIMERAIEEGRVLQYCIPKAINTLNSLQKKAKHVKLLAISKGATSVTFEKYGLKF